MKTGWTGHHSQKTIIFTLEFLHLQNIKKHQHHLWVGKHCSAYRLLSLLLIQLSNHLLCFLPLKWTHSTRNLYLEHNHQTQIRSKESRVLHQVFVDLTQTMISVSIRSPNHRRDCQHYCEKSRSRSHHHHQTIRWMC